MKKNILLSFCLLCAGSISACSSVSDETTYVPVEKDTQVIDTTVKPNDKCGVDGIGCNDTALINYTKTEADYRAYGERTKRDHLYTQAAAGNNLTATVRPGIEEDVVTEYEPEIDNETGETDFSPNDDLFMQTAANNVDPQNLGNGVSGSNASSPIYPNQVGHNENVEMYSYPGYEVTCSGDCSGFATDDGSITSEFTEDSFDINDYVKSNGGDEEIQFYEVGEKKDGEPEAETEITDDTVTVWEAKEGDNLRELLTAWSNQAGWKLLWHTNRNYNLSAGVMFKGKFTDVSSALVRAFARARPAPIATYYKGNRVIVVETMENENAY